ncbi:DAZ-associated protein 2 [Sabethes cyaneus]|uniref:DAZ-associated protein 2 n=1 Tax=Sabethes cyaneus TaxID=53552 RepID=UPI00237D5D86|nr:DAZ-associated protein 2 [Sabethes cyaneus]XP_053684854.1 DAZ-associated protein 2 [Sabethes cyaneus]
MNNKANNGYPYDAQSAAYQQYVNSQLPAHAQLPPSYNSVVTSMTPAGYSPYPPGLVQQPFYTNNWSVNPSAPQAATMPFAAHHLPPPPPYAAAAAQQAAVAAIPAQTVHPTMYQYPIATPPQAQPPQVYQAQMYPVQGAMYDAGARFGKTGGAATIPPPPPGIAPTAAQIAAMQGQQVVMTKKKNNFIHGGNGAGFTFW